MKKSITNSTFIETPVNVKEDSIEIADLIVSKDGLRGKTIEEQVGHLRQRLKWSETGAERLGKELCEARSEIMSLKMKLKKARARK